MKKYKKFFTWRQAEESEDNCSVMHEGLEKELKSSVGKRYNELIEQNSKFIECFVSPKIAKKISHIASIGALNGDRSIDNNEKFKKYTLGLSKEQINAISRTEISSSMAALTQAKAEDTGHDWYIWHTSEDVRVRPSHKKMDKVLCRFSDPPSPEELIGEKSYGHYNPGNIFNCRCYAAPVIIWSEVEWPHSVYFDDRIATMTKEEFKSKFYAEKLEYWD